MWLGYSARLGEAPWHDAPETHGIVIQVRLHEDIRAVLHHLEAPLFEELLHPPIRQHHRVAHVPSHDRGRLVRSRQVADAVLPENPVDLVEVPTLVDDVLDHMV